MGLSRLRARAFATTLATLLAAANGAAAQASLSPETVDRAVRSVVHLEVRQGEGVSNGSGTIIDPRGYIVTNFHVVGRTYPEGDHALGSLYQVDREVRIFATDSARVDAQFRYVGLVVRGNARLDFALIKIVRNADGTPIDPATRFPFTPPAATTHLSLGAQVFAIGYPLDARSPSITGGHIEGFQSNAGGALSWIRTDAEFNPGNSGGALIDVSGQLIGIPTRVSTGDRQFSPVEYARPYERLPDSFRAVMEEGTTDLSVEGVYSVGAEETRTLEANGDSLFTNREDRFVLAIPPDRPLRIHVPTPHSIALFHDGNDRESVRIADGSISLDQSDPPGTIAVVTVRLATGDAPPQPMNVEITTERGAAHAMGGLLGGAIGVGGLGLSGDPRTNKIEPATPPRLASAYIYLGGSASLTESSVWGGAFNAGFAFLGAFAGRLTPVRFGWFTGLAFTGGSWMNRDLYGLSLPIGLFLDIGVPDNYAHIHFAWMPGFVDGNQLPDVEWVGRGYQVGVSWRFLSAFGLGFRYREQIRGRYPVYRELGFHWELVF